MFDNTRFWLENKTFPADEITVRLHHRLTQIHGFPNGNVGHAWMMADPLVEKLGAKPVTSRRAREACDRLICRSKCPVRGPQCANLQNHKRGLARLDLNIARIERAEVLLRQYRASVFRRLEIEVDEFVHGAAVQEA
jgi:hypothetical protein